MAKQEFTVQSQFIKKLKETVSSNTSLVDEMADLLSVSTDSAYRRIRGETALTIDEVTKLCTHYRIPFDFVGKPEKSFGSTVTFHYHHLSDDLENFRGYLMNILNDMKRIKAADQKEIIFSGVDIPIFHHFGFLNLSAFKLFYWTKSILNVSQYEGKKFDITAIPTELKDFIAEIYSLYLEIPSIEIWSEDTINSTLKQVEYYWESGLFKHKEDALLVLEDIRSMIGGIEKQAAASTKFRGEVPPAGSTENYLLYLSDLMIGNNCILVTMNNNKVTYLTHNTFNSMATLSPSFSEESERWLRNLIKKSNLISGVSEKQRFRFFRMMNDKIDRVEENVNKG
ncbi:MAG: hypothetical protein HY064_12390 [Bacteroidetes bacterium]|nr:hypothetical protein [Bacteroidota bacterium]